MVFFPQFSSNNQLFLRGNKNRNGLYEINQQTLEQLLSIPPIICVVHQYSKDPYLNIHACLGHASMQRTRFVCQCNNIKGIKLNSIKSFDSIRNCEACRLAKATKRSFPGHFATPQLSAQVWQFDVKGKISLPSVIFGSHYEYGFIDLFSRKLFTYYTPNKDSETTLADINVIVSM